MPSEKKFKVAICGAGIGGLTTAVALSQYPDIEVEIFEAAEKLAEIGAGFGLFPRPWEVIQKLNLEEDLLRCTDIQRTDGPVPSFIFRRGDRAEGIEFYTAITKGNLMTFHRPDFQKVLLRHLPPSYQVHCSKRLRSYCQQPGGSINLLFEDGTQASCDVLLGADGLKSAVRRSLLNEHSQWAQCQGNCTEAANLTSLIEPSWTGINAYRALITREKLRIRSPNHRVFTQPIQYIGRNGHVVAYPISHGKMINFVAFSGQHHLEGTKYTEAWVSPANKNEFSAIFRDWEPEVQALLDCVDHSLRWAIHTVKPLKSYVYGNVAILGDAAHAMTPFQGSGAGQAVEDAYTLALLLGHPLTTKATISRALSIYDHIRRPLSQDVQERSRLNGLYYTLKCEEIDFSKLPEKEMLAKLKNLGEVISKNSEWAWTTSIDGLVEEALRLIESR